MSFLNTFEFNHHQFSNRNRSVAIIILLSSVILIFWSAPELGFTNWDDNLYLTENANIQNFEFDKVFSAYSVGLYTPLVSLSYMLDYYLFQLNPSYYHIENVAWHALNCLLIYLLVLRLTKHEFSSFITALLFAIHPLHVEPVAWISSRKDLLFTFFYLLAWIQYLGYIAQPKVRFLFFTIVFFILSCAAKPAAVSFPLVALFMNFIYTGSKRISDYLHLAPLFFIALVTGLGTLYGAYILDLRKTPDAGYAFLEYVYFSTYGIIFYLVKLIFPSDLVNYYVYPSPGTEFPMTYVLSPFLFISLLGALFFYWKRLRFLFVPLLLSVLMLSPMLRFAPQGFPMVADRYFYLASLGILMIPGILIAKSNSANLKLALYGICLLFGILFVFISKRQLKVWKNSNTLWTHNLAVYPDFYFAYQERGKYFLNLGNKERALKDFQKSLSLQENNPELITNVANIISEIGSKDDALALQNLAVEKSKSAMTYYNRANTYKAKEDYLLAIEDYDMAIKLDTNLAQAYNNRGVCYIMIENREQAFLDFKKACFLDSENQMFRDNLNRIEKMLE